MHHTQGNLDPRRIEGCHELHQLPAHTVKGAVVVDMVADQEHPDRAPN